ncbi:putative beta-lysine N-acetyltransferase [Chitinispirillales bacterium ANBcel5]|uniref:putative beta-lysine N-acetyltransferase n=1 Tax=Cellulosispirillum alkaliphilum TaxID=3039283 RepID=UPI002A527146|nr:putative beta-lysine N-acetyltransferase [Chitinispirillales bacterium ANBcel5]
MIQDTQEFIPDEIVKVGNSLIQHGKWNDRVYIMKTTPDDCTNIINESKKLAQENDYSKIFAKIPFWAKEAFSKEKFETEAVIPRDEKSGGDILFMSLFLKEWRSQYCDYDTCKGILDSFEKEPPKSSKRNLPDRWTISKCTPEDAPEMAEVYKQVFRSYPFEIDNPEYICQTMESNINYYCVKDEVGKIIALSSAELDPESSCAEMSDFATLPKARGNHCAGHLLGLMHEDVEESGICTPFTIARATSPAMNTVFARNGYIFGGTLKNNTHIGESLEDMNVWYLNKD